MQFKAKLECEGGPDRAQARLEAFRERALPGTEYGVTLSNLVATDESGIYAIDVEIDADDAAEAEEAFDRMREATRPGSYGLVLYGLEAVEPSPGMGI